jgi:hypothetical protein
MAAASILFGNLAALKQHNVKRLIGLSGVSHAGSCSLPWSRRPVPGAVGAVYFYLIAYLIASFAVFGVMTVLAGPDDADQELGDYAGLAKESPFLAGVLACGLGSLAGIPPFAGFMGKLFVFVAAFKAGITGCSRSRSPASSSRSTITSDGSARPISATRPPCRPRDRPAACRGRHGLRVSLAALAAASIILGFYQGPLGRLGVRTLKGQANYPPGPGSEVRRGRRAAISASGPRARPRAAAPVPVARPPSRARDGSGGGGRSGREPDPAAVPVPVAADPEKLGSGRHGNRLDDGGGGGSEATTSTDWPGRGRAGDWRWHSGPRSRPSRFHGRPIGPESKCSRAAPRGPSVPPNHSQRSWCHAQWPRIQM